MGIIASLKITKRSLTRRKTKNLSAIFAIALGVTLMVGIQITTDTLENTFLTSLLLREGEVDIRISNATGRYLTTEDRSNISALVPDAVGIMPELKTTGSVMVGSQFESNVKMAGVPLNYPLEFGSFFGWKSGEILAISNYLVDNSSILIASELAEDLGINRSSELPLALNTEFNKLTVIPLLNETTGLPIINLTTGFPILTVELTVERIELSIVGMYDSKRPGIGASYQGVLFSLKAFQHWQSLQDPFRNTNIISAYLIAFQTDHFNTPIDEEYLQERFDALEETIPEKNVNGRMTKVYALESSRLLNSAIIELVITMLSSFLNVLGLLITITGILLITNVQLMSIEDREFQTGVLRAVGEKRMGIFQSMLFETFFQGIIGGILGLGGGLIFGQLVAVYLVSIFGSGSASVQPVMTESVIAYSVIVGVFLGILTGLLPALRASRVNVVEALRGIKLGSEGKSSRNLIIVGVFLSIIGCMFLLNNGFFNEELQFIWQASGWDSIKEWENILLGGGFLVSGLGIVISRYTSRRRAFSLTAIALWSIPVFMFVVALGEGWIIDIVGAPLDVFIFSIIEIVIGSVLIVGINLTPLMRFLRGNLIKINGVKGVAQVAPALISSHTARSTLTFAIFAVILTLNVTVASLIATNIDNTIGKADEDSRGIDLFVTLSKPEQLLNGTSYTEELYQLDSHITDIIGLKTFSTMTDFTKFVALENPYSPEFNPQYHLLPLGYGELRSDQIRGEAINASDDNWRYDFYLGELPDGVRQPGMSALSAFGIGGGSHLTDEESLFNSKKAWDIFFDPSYTMSAYNISFDLAGLADLDIEQVSEMFSKDLYEVETLKDINGSVIKNPIVFTDSILLPLGMQIWVPMNTSVYGYPIYQPFVIGGSFDIQRAGGFPLSPFDYASIVSISSDFLSTGLGNIYLPERYAKFTNFLGEADGITPISRAQNQYNAYFIKTDYAIDHPKIESIAKTIEEFTNSEDTGYREIIGDNFTIATATSLYSKLETSLEMMERMTTFLQIYVNFGLIIGSIGMAVISIRNVAERKREIGMMRAIGFPRSQVMFAALLELLVLGFIGLMIGIINGLSVNVGFANMLSAPIIIPLGTISLYVSFITFIGLFAGAIPGWIASRIPPAEALRYVG